MTHLLTVERDPENELENITQNKLPAQPNPAEEQKQVSWIISQDPDVVMVDMVENPKTAADLAEFDENKRVYVGVRAGTAFEAIAAWRKLIGDDKLALKNLSLVVAGPSSTFCTFWMAPLNT